MCQAPPPRATLNHATCCPSVHAAASPNCAGLSPPCHAAVPSARATLRRRLSSSSPDRHRWFVVGRALLPPSLPGLPIKPGRSLSRLPSLSSSPRTSSRAAELSTGKILAAPSYSSQFQHAKASSPPLLAPRPTLAKPALLLGRNRRKPCRLRRRRNPSRLNVDDPLPPHLRPN
jgi:hypothetical protein